MCGIWNPGNHVWMASALIHLAGLKSFGVSYLMPFAGKRRQPGRGGTRQYPAKLRFPECGSVRCLHAGKNPAKNADERRIAE